MPAVPQYNQKPIKSIYNPSDVHAKASLKQKSLIDTLYRRRDLPVPDMEHLTKGQAAALISGMLDV